MNERDPNTPAPTTNSSRRQANRLLGLVYSTGGPGGLPEAAGLRLLQRH